MAHRTGRTLYNHKRRPAALARELPPEASTSSGSPEKRGPRPKSHGSRRLRRSRAINHQHRASALPWPRRRRDFAPEQCAPTSGEGEAGFADGLRALNPAPFRPTMPQRQGLRHVSPVQMTKPRFAICDGELHGRHFRRGDMFAAFLAAANCDPAKSTFRTGSTSRATRTRTSPSARVCTSVSGSSLPGRRPRSRSSASLGASQTCAFGLTRPRSRGTSASAFEPSQAYP